MSANKIVETNASVAEFLRSLDDPQQRADSDVLIELMTRIVGRPAKMWGSSIVGFGQYHYKYASGREGDFFLSGFAPRKGKLSIHVIAGFERYGKQLEQLGKHKTTVSCLYIKSLAAINITVLESIISDSVETTRKLYS